MAGPVTIAAANTKAYQLAATKAGEPLRFAQPRKFKGPPAAQDTRSTFAVLALPLTVLLLALAANWGVQQLNLQLTPAATKPYGSITEFFPFYLTEHSTVMCRRLHFLGTSIVLVIAMMFPSVFLNMGVAGAIGTTVMPLTRHMPNGIVEAAAALGSFAWLTKHTTGRWSVVMAIMLAGYGCAWVGHFVYEANKPASFIYPTYSLFSDFMMWANIARGTISM